MYRAMFLLATVNVGVEGRCPTVFLSPLPFVLEYAVWRGWQQAILFNTKEESACAWATVRLQKCLSVNGIASSAHAGSTRVRSRLGVVMRIRPRNQNATAAIKDLIAKLTKQNMNSASFDWLIIANSAKDLSKINRILNATAIRFDQNIIVAYPTQNTSEKRSGNRHVNKFTGLCDHNFIYKMNRKQFDHPQKYFCPYKNKECEIKNIIMKNNSIYYRTTERFKNLTKDQTYTYNGKVIPLYNSGFINYNYSLPFIMTNISKFSLSAQIRERHMAKGLYANQIHIVQYFKVRINSTLYARFLGSWSRNHSMSGLQSPYPVEARSFLGEEMVFGRCNATPADSSDEGPASPAALDDILYYLAARLNATTVTRYYSKLGLRTYEGTWSGLLGGLVDSSIDVALEPVTALSAAQDMELIFPIAETMCNIYIRQQETSTVRDIFLAPFSLGLVACVAGVALAAAAAIVFASRLGQDQRRMGYTEALLWATSILCQQGGTWTPPTPAGSVLLLVCLLFGVVTYNAYAAFITSVLSVRVASVDTVAAVLREPSFQIGYIQNGADQMYLMSTKDVQLNEVYIRGYSNAENLVSSAGEGLARAASHDYAFFAGQRAARSTLRSLSQARGRCAVREVPVHSTRAHLAFPLPKGSPYARPTLVSLLQLRGAGALGRLEAALVPDMPHCAPPPGFTSARANDVRSALLLLLTGYVASMCIGIAEYSWKKRSELRAFMLKCCGCCWNILKQI